MKFKSILKPDKLIFLILIVNAIVGVFIAESYGVSWDIGDEIKTGNFLAEYISFNNFFSPEEIPDLGGLKFYGPSFVLISKIFVDAFLKINGNVETYHAYYYLNFLSYIFGTYFLYKLLKRFVSEWPALLSVLIFFYQPLLFGHAFINYKDIPSMAFFIISIETGLMMADKIRERYSKEEVYEGSFFRSLFATIKIDWQSKSQEQIKKRERWIIGFAFVLLMIFLLWLPILKLLNTLVTQAYNLKGNAYLINLFNSVANNRTATGVEAYISKLTTLFNFGYLAILITYLLFLFGLATSKFPGFRRDFVSPYIEEINIKDIFNFIRDPKVLIAGILYGLSITTRIIGLFTGGLVGLFALMRLKHKASVPLISYSIVAAITTYLTWPYLWGTGLSGFFTALKTMTNFEWDATVLFQGVFYQASELPANYLPTLLSIQFTLPLLILIIFGIIISIIWVRDKKIEPRNLLIVSLWFFVPFIYAVLTQPTMFDNFRHYFFIAPPIAVFSGIGLEALFKKIKVNWIKFLIAIVLLATSILPILRLHPYEYVYYNELVGGNAGAFRQYELDYWNTSMMDAMRFINSEAPLNSSVIVWGSGGIAHIYARDDLEIVGQGNIGSQRVDDFDYAVLNTRFDADLLNALSGETILEFGKDGGIFVVVRKFGN